MAMRVVKSWALWSRRPKLVSCCRRRFFAGLGSCKVCDEMIMKRERHWRVRGQTQKRCEIPDSTMSISFIIIYHCFARCSYEQMHLNIHTTWNNMKQHIFPAKTEQMICKKSVFLFASLEHMMCRSSRSPTPWTARGRRPPWKPLAEVEATVVWPSRGGDAQRFFWVILDETSDIFWNVVIKSSDFLQDYLRGKSWDLFFGDLNLNLRKLLVFTNIFWVMEMDPFRQDTWKWFSSFAMRMPKPGLWSCFSLFLASRYHPNPRWT